MGQTPRRDYTLFSHVRRDEPSVVLHHAVLQSACQNPSSLSRPLSVRVLSLFCLKNREEKKVATSSHVPFVLRNRTHHLCQLATGFPNY